MRHTLTLLVVGVACVLIGAGPAAAAIQGSITSPGDGAHSLQGVVQVAVTASADDGVYSVLLYVDGQPWGIANSIPVRPYQYVIPWDTSTVSPGDHVLTVLTTDWSLGLVTQMSGPVHVDVGPAYPTVRLASPASWTFVRGSTPIAVASTNAIGPASVAFTVDGAPIATPWNTAAVADGVHTLAATITDGRGKTGSDSETIVVDNTAPTVLTFQPSADARITGPASFQVHSSDAFGIKSVRFTVDGTPVGALLTVPDANWLYIYTITYDTLQLAAGSHTVSAIATDYAGNTASPVPVTIRTGATRYLPVLNYHSIAPPDGYNIYNQTLGEADQQFAYLKANGYQGVSLEQYQQWLAGADIGVAKPVLITVDDALNGEYAWDGLLQKYGLKGVLFVITGFADNTTPGNSDSNNMTWKTINQLAVNGRWQVSFHAGQYGHGDKYAGGTTITLNATQTLGLPASCPYFYTCLGTVTTTTTTGSGRKQKTTTTDAPETFATFKSLMTNEITAGLAELKQKVPSASLLAWAAPFNNAGQWTNLYNDPSGQVQAWVPSFFASKFPLVFTQTNPITYASASGTVGSLTGFNRQYRFEVHTDTTIGQFATALQDPAFGR